MSGILKKWRKLKTSFLFLLLQHLFFTDAELVDENLKPLGYSQWQSNGFNQKEQDFFTHGKFIEVLLTRNFVTGSTMAFRSEFKKLIFPIPNDWVHDGWISLLIAFASDLNLISEPLIRYRQHHMQQVGAGDEGLTLYQKIHRKINQLQNLESDYSNFQPECIRYTLAYEHLVNSRFPSIKTNKIPLLKARASHYCIRSHLPVSRIKRIPFIIKEILNMNYHRYSEGISSVVGDLLRNNSEIK